MPRRRAFTMVSRRHEGVSRSHEALVVDPAVESAIRTAASIRKKSSSRCSEAFGARAHRRLSLINVTDADLREQLERLAALRGERLGLLPELSYLIIRDSQASCLFYLGEGHWPPQRHTFIAGAERTRARRQRAHCSSGSDRRISKCVFPARAKRIAGIRPSGLFPEIRGRLRIPDDRFAVRRTDPKFWEFSDLL